MFDAHNSEREDVPSRNNAKIKNLIKDKKMRAVRSQDKYKDMLANWQNEDNPSSHHIALNSRELKDKSTHSTHRETNREIGSNRDRSANRDKSNNKDRK